MQIYNGPSRRVLRKIKEDTDSGFTIDGVRSQEEERAIYVRQSFTLKQYEDRAAVNALPPIDAQWTYPEEKDEFSHHVGNDPANAKLPTPFTSKHVLTDRLLLNKSFKDVYFQPDNAHNFLKVSNLEAAQMAPLLCSKKQFENVTIAPKVTGLTPYEVQDTVLAPLNMYGKYWFGTLHDMAGIANRTGEAPYFLALCTAFVQIFAARLSTLQSHSVVFHRVTQSRTRVVPAQCARAVLLDPHRPRIALRVMDPHTAALPISLAVN